MRDTLNWPLLEEIITFRILLLGKCLTGKICTDIYIPELFVPVGSDRVINRSIWLSHRDLQAPHFSTTLTLSN